MKKAKRTAKVKLYLDNLLPNLLLASTGSTMHKNRNPKTLFHTNHEKSTKLL
jgi:hypothetical protein